MARNDVIVLDAIIDERVSAGIPSGKVDEVFEYFTFEQILKDYDLSTDEFDSGWVDGRDDGGIDGLFILINGSLLQDVSTFVWPKRNAEIEVRIITSKHHDTFQQAPLNSLFASLTELLDLSNEDSALQEKYSSEIIQIRNLFSTAYRQLSAARPKLSFHLAYASRGDSTKVASNVRTRADQITELIESLFSNCSAAFDFVGAAELVALYRRTKTFSLELPVVEYLSREDGSYICLARLKDYYTFVTDEAGHLRRYLFDSNVRDYLGENRVNADIATTLDDPGAPDFWALSENL